MNPIRSVQNPGVNNTTPPTSTIAPSISSSVGMRPAFTLNALNQFQPLRSGQPGAGDTSQQDQRDGRSDTDQGPRLNQGVNFENRDQNEDDYQGYEHDDLSLI